MFLTLYSINNCPKCNILKQKLIDNKLCFKTITGEEATNTISSNGFLSAPILKINGKMTNYKKAMEWLDNLEGKQEEMFC